MSQMKRVRDVSIVVRAVAEMYLHGNEVEFIDMCVTSYYKQ